MKSGFNKYSRKKVFWELTHPETDEPAKWEFKFWGTQKPHYYEQQSSFRR